MFVKESKCKTDERCHDPGMQPIQVQNKKIIPSIWCQGAPSLRKKTKNTQSSSRVGHDPPRRSGQEVLKNSGGRVGPGQEVFHISRVESGGIPCSWVGSGRVGSGRVGSGRVGSGRVGSGHPDSV